jgi:uncharacterized protein
MRISLISAAIYFAVAGFQNTPSFARAQTASPVPGAPTAVQRTANPALWVVKDEDTTIYLFGTIHLLPEGLNWNLGAVKAAFEASDTLKLEIANIEAETPLIQAAMAEKGLLPAGARLGDGLTPTQLDQLDRVEREAGLPPKALDPMRPWLASTVLAVTMVQKLGLDPTKGVDKTLDSLARARGIPVEGFESGAEQINFLAGMSEEQQREMLVSTLVEWDKGREMVEGMVNAWARGDANRVGRLISGSLRSQPDLARVLLTDRNQRWADWIASRMAAPGTVFVAVGAGHLAGPDSVQTYLRRKNIRAQRVPNPPR